MTTAMDTINDMNTAPAPPITSVAAKEVTVPMRAIVHRRYGTPDVFAFEELRERPFQGGRDS